MPEVMEFYRMAGDVDYMLRVVVADMHAYDLFYKKLIAALAAEKCHIALCDGEYQVGDRVAGAGVRGRVIAFGYTPVSCPGCCAARRLAA